MQPAERRVGDAGENTSESGLRVDAAVGVGLE